MQTQPFVEQPTMLDQIMQRLAALEGRAPMAPLEPAAMAPRPARRALTPVQIAELVLRGRRARAGYFAAAFFGEPAYDILLDLFISSERGRNVSVTSACLAAAVPATTASRAIAMLVDAGLAMRAPDPRDARRQFLRLTDTGRDSTERFLRKLAEG